MSTEPIEIDGAQGEGGGQVLRTALALSLCQNRPVRIVNIRRARDNPGLRRQHLVAVQAAAAIGDARVQGAQLGSQCIEFVPRQLRPGGYHFDIGSAGSTTLVLQTVLPALLTAQAPSRLILEGGTHNPMAPPFEFLEQAFLPLINRMGPRVTAQLERFGFYPAGGGRITVEIEPCRRLQGLQLAERGRVLEQGATALVAHLPLHIAERELGVIGAGLGLAPESLRAREVPAQGPGNALALRIRSEALTEVFSGIGERGVVAELVARRVLDEARAYLAAGVPVGVHLADQLLLPLALAGAGSYCTLQPSAHAATNAAVIERFLPLCIAFQTLSAGRWRVRIGPR